MALDDALLEAVDAGELPEVLRIWEAPAPMVGANADVPRPGTVRGYIPVMNAARDAEQTGLLQ